MFMRLSTALLSVVLFGVPTSASPQVPLSTRSKEFEFLPGGTLFKPLIANPQEPRVGVRKEIGSSRLKLDIGSMIDFVEFRANDSGTLRFRMGADFFTYALTTSAQGLRLQVDAVDGFFGGHLLMRSGTEAHNLTLRLRMLHLSAHLIDGHFDIATGQWKDGRLPIPFTRDFGELVAAYTVPFAGCSGLIYAGVNYATLVRPADVQRVLSLCGCEFHTGDSFGLVLGKPFALYAAYNLTLMGVPRYVGTSVIEGGVKFGGWQDIGLKFYVNYASGLEFFSQYYNVRRSMWGTGFTIDFF
jgi:hypothetical protein